VSWCLEQWKKLEDIRHLRTNTAKLKDVPAAQEMAAKFDEVIEQTIQLSIRQEAERLATAANTSEARQNELTNHLVMALQGLLARIERGLTVDIRFLAPPQEGEGDEELAIQMDELCEIRQQLVFPPIGDSPPLLSLTKQPESQRRRRGGPQEPTAA
jgi:hypothetical protein